MKDVLLLAQSLFGSSDEVNVMAKIDG